ncbi:MAG: quinolinate synthase NadA [Phycisphaerae bacterium]|nr:quinolinate synthase NadA [Phycisphaerae bacterium]
MPFQPPLPDEYQRMADPDVLARIAERKAALGRRVVILGHHYQEDDIVRFADFVGDSFKLSRQASQTTAEFIVFCGVHFMAESADILSSPGQQVILPDLSAGCSMAEMADEDDVVDAWETISRVGGEPIVPICYVNSTAAVKAFVGRHGGTACTSSNARRAIAWALGRGENVKLLFIPDQHLGRNTAFEMGYPLESMAVWDPAQRNGGLTDEQIRAARFILWNGYCSVHQIFTVADIDRVRAERPGVQVIVHPECDFAVVQKADQSGSTERIGQVIDAAPPGSAWAVGTEIHLVKRLADRYRGEKHVQSLTGIQCLCTTMYRIDPRHLLWSLDNLAAGRVVNRVTVDEPTKQLAKLALDQMLALPG